MTGRRARRGNYVLLLAVALVVVLGFGALALDVAFRLMAQAQAQDVADAASHAAVIVLRQTGSADAARDAVARVVEMNEVAGHPAEVSQLVFGSWDDTQATPRFRAALVRPNAVRVEVAREGDNAVPFLLSKIWGYEAFPVRARATSASRSVQFAIVLDITGSWGERDFANARLAVITAIDMLAATASDVDQVGMTIFTNRYGWEYTPFVNIADPDEALAVRAAWQQLNIASKAGRDLNQRDGADCVLNGAPAQNDFANPAGGCYPQMPREYTDESGTDHSAGILLAQQMYEELSGGANYRAMIVLTDGRPNYLGGESGEIRASQGYVEDRWREYQGPVPRSTDAVRTASIAATGQLWDELRVHTWAVSLIADDWMFPPLVQGDGYYVRTNNSGELASLMAQIISEMPLAIVE